jgi:membrane-bound serine protease (ClpP class)
LIALFFISQYVAGMAGNEAVVFFLFGVVLVLAELLFLPGLLFLAIPGILLMLGSLLWAMVDFWPGGMGNLSGDLFIQPVIDLIFGLSIAVLGAIVLGRLLKGSAVESALVLSRTVGGPEKLDQVPSEEASEEEFPELGASGVALTPLHPAGLVEVAGQRYEARCEVGIIDRGTAVRVVGREDFNLLVEEAGE